MILKKIILFVILLIACPLHSSNVDYIGLSNICFTGGCIVASMICFFGALLDSSSSTPAKDRSDYTFLKYGCGLLGAPLVFAYTSAIFEKYVLKL